MKDISFGNVEIHSTALTARAAARMKYGQRGKNTDGTPPPTEYRRIESVKAMALICAPSAESAMVEEEEDVDRAAGVPFFHETPSLQRCGGSMPEV